MARSCYSKPNSPYTGMTMDEVAAHKRTRRMNEIDALDPATRALVHDYGYNTVKAIRDAGVTRPAQIKHIVEAILNDFIPTRGSYSRQGIRTEVPDTPTDPG